MSKIPERKFQDGDKIYDNVCKMSGVIVNGCYEYFDHEISGWFYDVVLDNGITEPMVQEEDLEKVE